jgi:alpha-N-arabinofuranosidase
MQTSLSHVSHRRSRPLLLALAALGAGLAGAGRVSAADPGKIVVRVDQPGAKIHPLFYGIMTEEINYSYEGGLYAELIRNRIFKNPHPQPRGARRGPPSAAGTPAPLPAPEPPAPTGIPAWSVVQSAGSAGAISLDNADPINAVALTTSLRLDVTTVAAGGRVGVANAGYWGIPARPHTTYQASFYARASHGFTGPLTLDLESSDGQTLHASTTVPAITDRWQRYQVTLQTGSLVASAANRFVISASTPGTIHLNLVSLFPPVFKARTGPALGARPATGFRPDILQLLADLKPAFLRFPGGNYVEGSNFANRFDFKTTIGPWEQRPGHQSPWGYRSSDGLGLLEFLEWCEEINLEPVLAVYAGLNLDRGVDVKTGAALQPLIQDALDEIEYVTGDAHTAWGARRARDGHPAPFPLNFVEIGNEDFLNNGTATYRGPTGRFALFYRAIKAKYPHLQVIATTDPESPHDVIDEHFYMNFDAARNRAHMYDPEKRPRTTADGQPAPRVFVGEWATRDGNPTPSFHAALTDAAFLTGLERNADLVIMSGYAPLFVNLSDPAGPARSMQWATDLIGYDALTAFGSPSYYVQKMFYNNRGDVVLPITVAPQVPAAIPPPPPANPARQGRGPAPITTPLDSLFASSTRENATGDIILKIVNTVDTPQQMEISLEGVSTVGPQARMEVLAGALTDVNSVAEPTKVAPQSAMIDVSTKFVREFPGHTVTVIRFATK